MGRTKSTPRQHVSVASVPAASLEAAPDDSFLGRRRVDPSVSVDLLLAHELLSEQQSSSRRNRLEELEQQATAAAALRGTRKRAAAKKAVALKPRKRKKVKVSFIQDDDDDDEGKNNPSVKPLELSVHSCDAASKTDDLQQKEAQQQVPLISIPAVPEWNAARAKVRQEWSQQQQHLLCHLHLEARVEYDSESDTPLPNDPTTRVSIPLVTGRAVWQVWKLAVTSDKREEENGALRAAVERAVESQLIRVQLLVDNDDAASTSATTKPSRRGVAHRLGIFLTPTAWQACHGHYLPVARRQGKKFQSAADLTTMLQALLQSTTTSTLSSISAKQVYSLTDNVQLQAALKEPPLQSEPLVIPGLVPQLRPYQEQAVRWMLQREQVDNIPQHEWQLAWLVLVQPHNAKTPLEGMPLSEWCKQQSSLDMNAPVILYCPSVGWLASSVNEARLMTLGSPDATTACRGGILAESMGLGKTVEVLACLLAHPRPHVVATMEEDSSQARRRLDFAETVPLATPIAAAQTGHVVDMNDFADVDSDDEDEEAPRAMTTNGTLAAVVTPDKARVAIPERWTDDFEVGSCICGDLVDFTCQQRQPIVLCQSCDEPMHYDCAAMENDVLEKETTALRLRRTFSDDVLDCRVCQPDKCPCCLASVGQEQVIQSRATLIITPAAILQQWEREVERHTRVNGNPLKVVVYEGIDRACKSSSSKKRSTKLSVGNNNSNPMKYIHPRHLGDADIVLMTFDSLMSDLGHSDDNRFVAGDESASNLRRRKKYRVVPSPLLSIEWWRVCLDEAQRVETPTAKSARMALKLRAVHRWCVSGTPIGRGKLEDLYGLLLFLRLNPFANKAFFDKCLHPAHFDIDSRIKTLLRHLFWRSTMKLDLVREQMGVPEQMERKELLNFSSIEKHFYNQQLELTLSAVGDVVEREKSGKQGKASQLELLATQLHRLRAACCHPQVGSSGIGKHHRISGKKHDTDGAVVSVSSRVLSMHQILDRFIDEARQKCEEAQRLAVMHTNAMAAITRLKVEAKTKGVTNIQESDTALLSKSCKLYLESLQLSEENAVPTLVIGDAVLSGTVGFRSSRMTARGGKCTFDWKRESVSCRKARASAWSMVEFEGPARKITELRLQPLASVPKELVDDKSHDFEWRVLHPKDCVFQVANAAVGGEFVDVVSFELAEPTDSSDTTWTIHGGFRTNKSKNWRLVVNSLHEVEDDWNMDSSNDSVGYYFGVNVEFYEDDVASDPLQRLHCLHNGTLTFSTLLEASSRTESESSDTFLAPSELQERIDSMTREGAKIESLYMDSAMALHATCHTRLAQATQQRLEHDSELMNQSPKDKRDLLDCWDEGWWDDFLVTCHLYANETQQLAVRDRLLQDLEGVLQTPMEVTTRRNIIAFPEFTDLHGFRTALSMRMRDIRSGLGQARTRTSRTALQAAVDSIAGESNQQHVLPKDVRFKCPAGAHSNCMQSIVDLSKTPTQKEVMENSMCKVCKADWGRTGPKCNHCKIGEVLEDLTPDRVTCQVLKAIHGIAKSPLGQSILKSGSSKVTVEERASAFFDVIDAQARELKVAWRLWRVHLDLLNDLDELNQCKSTMRLAYDGEDLTDRMEDELNAIVVPMDVSARYHDHAAKQAMAEGDLRRAKDTLRYLKNLTKDEENDSKDEPCVVCLCEFTDSDKAVLRCGHSFHYSPCLEKLQASAGGANAYIPCPLRCRVRTKRDQVMIATSKARDDGTKSKRPVQGSWGTKVTRLVADVMDMRDAGEKGVVFSQWEDMMDIVQEALTANGIRYARATSLRKIGAATQRFREADCSLLLLNVKNGAEGLTLLEATHVFVIEPVLNHGLDSQAIHRVHRIGQNKKTYVWRYLVRDTIEMKIDKRRVESLDDDDQAVPDGVSGRDKKTKLISAGGIDGGFEANELLSLLQDT